MYFRQATLANGKWHRPGDIGHAVVACPHSLTIIMCGPAVSIMACAQHIAVDGFGLSTSPLSGTKCPVDVGPGVLALFVAYTILN